MTSVEIQLLGGFEVMVDGLPRWERGRANYSRACALRRPVAPTGGEAPFCVGRVAGARERFRGFAEHRLGLRLIALHLAENPPRLPHRTDPRTRLPHTGDALGLGEERARSM